MPYLYSAMVSAHEAHVPVLKPTFVAFEDDPASFADADAAMFGPCLLAAPAMREGAREVEVYLPQGVESWRDFWTGRIYAGRSERDDPGAPESAAAARASRSDRRHDRQRRRLLRACTTSPRGLCGFFPAPARARRGATLFEDDGISLAGASTRVTIALSWTSSRVSVAVGRSGDYPLPYSGMRVILPEHERRTVVLSGAEGIGLRL